MRTTEMMIQLMGCMQREAKTLAGTETRSTDEFSFDSGVAVESAGPSSNSEGEMSLQDSSSSSLDMTAAAKDRAQLRKLSAPGIDVYTGMRRECVQDGNPRRKDTGSEVSFIVLE
jgi:hypothetical protein